MGLINEWYVRINPGSGVCSWTHGDIAVKAVIVKSPGHLFWEYIHVLPSHNIFISRKYVNGPISCISAHSICEEFSDYIPCRELEFRCCERCKQVANGIALVHNDHRLKPASWALCIFGVR